MNSIITKGNKSVSISLVSLSIWIVALVINAVADTAYIGIKSAGWEGIGTFSAILPTSAILSVPGAIVFWLIFILTNKNKNLFNILMITVILTAAASVLFLLLFFGWGSGSDLIFFVSIAVLSGLISTALHYNLINTILNKEE